MDILKLGDFLKNNADLRSLFESSLRIGPNHEAIIDRILQTAEGLFSSGQHDLVLVILDNLTRLYPVSAKSWSGLAIAQARVGRLACSLDSLRRALTISPEAPTTAALRCQVLSLQPGNEDLEVAMVRDALITGNDAEKWRLLGMHCGRRKRMALAATAFERSVSLAPNNVVRRALIQSLIDLGRNRDALDEIERLDDLDDPIFNVFCNICTEIGAHATLRRGIARWLPKLPESRSRADLAMGFVWRGLGDPVREKAAFKSARADPRLIKVADEELRAHTFAHGCEADIIDIVARSVPWRHRAPVGWSPPRLEDVETIHTLDPDDKFNIATNIILARYLGDQGETFAGRELYIHERMALLFRRSFPHLRIRAYDPGVERLDLGPRELHLREAGLVAFERGLTDHKASTPLLRTDPEVLVEERGRTSTVGRKRIGICWRSTRIADVAENQPRAALSQEGASFERYIDSSGKFWRKCIPLSFFKPLIRDAEFSAESLQYGLEDWEVDYLENHPDYGGLTIDSIDHRGDLDAIAARLASLDAFVSIPCGYAHMSAALGVPTFLLINDVFPMYWMWQKRFPVYQKVYFYQKPPIWRDGDMVVRKNQGDWSLQIDNIINDIKNYNI